MSLGSVMTSLILLKLNITSETGLLAEARPWLIQLKRFPNVTRPTSLRDMGARTGSWSNDLSRVVSIASEQGEFEVTVVTGFKRRVRMVALENASEGLAESVGEGGLDEGGVGGKRSLATRQSSSTN